MRDPEEAAGSECWLISAPGVVGSGEENQCMDFYIYIEIVLQYSYFLYVLCNLFSSIIKFTNFSSTLSGLLTH